MTFDIEKHARPRLRKNLRAPGGPGEAPRWTTGAKTAAGTAISQQSRVWFTIANGVLDEIYFPTVDQANTRRIRFLITDGQEFLSDERSDADHNVRATHPLAPGYRIESCCRSGQYRLRKEVIADPARDAVLLETEFEPLGSVRNLQLYVLIDPHIADEGARNHAWVGEYKGIQMLFARRGDVAMAVACSSGFEQMTCGYAGVSDGYRDLVDHRRLTAFYTEALQGNVSLCGRIAGDTGSNRFSLALGFGSHGAEAALQARASLLEDPSQVREKYIRGWIEHQRRYCDLGGGPEKNSQDLYRVSTAVLQVHESKRFPGGVIASLAIPWGFDRGDNDIAGYHVLWPRDMVQAALGKLACGDAESALRTLSYMASTQEQDGHWPQNMWLDGTANWTAIQMDSTGFAVLLADALRRSGELAQWSPTADMVRAAAGFLAKNGPCTQQDRWEENAGYDPNTMSVEIAALLAAADFADEQQDSRLAEFLRATADAWSDAIDELTYVAGTDLDRQHGVRGHYVRIAPPEVIRTGLSDQTLLTMKNLPENEAVQRAVDVVSPGTLALVRFGMRSAQDPRIVDSLKIIDATLRSELLNGPVWHRYTSDGYGEKEDGAPFDKTGKGRGWPLLTGERAHYEIAAGNFEVAERLLHAIAAQTNECGLIPEQVWDAADLPERGLFNGQPTGSGMPLVWAHAEYVRLLRSLRERRVWDMPPQTVQRYQVDKKTADFMIWNFNHQRQRLASGKKLRLDLWNSARVHWSSDGWQTREDTGTIDSGIGLHYAMLPVSRMKPGEYLRFTMFWLEANKWEGRNFEVKVI